MTREKQESVVDKIYNEISHLVFRPYESRDTLDRRDVMEILGKYRAESEEDESMTEVIKVEDCGSNIGDYDIPIHNAIIIPKGATNGDVIMALFPNIYTQRGEIDLFTTLDDCTTFTYDWWDAPYKAENEE